VGNGGGAQGGGFEGQERIGAGDGLCEWGNFAKEEAVGFQQEHQFWAAAITGWSDAGMACPKERRGGRAREKRE
jgi:hypothetical protein